MKTASKITGSVFAATLALTPLYNLAHAEDGTVVPEDAAAEQAAPVSSLMDQIKVSEVARSAVTGIHNAKQALSAGDSDTAKTILDEVTGSFSDDDAALALKTDAGYFLPIDQGIGFVEGFTPTEEHKPVFEEADKLMRTGDINGVVSTLNDAGIDVVAQIAVLPYSSTLDGLKQVVADIDAGELEKAGSDLDAMLASVQVESYAPDAMPSQGYEPAEITQG